MTMKYFDDFWTPENLNASFFKVRRCIILYNTLQKMGIEKYDNILEVGSGTGRNLQHLWLWGYRRLTGVEFNRAAFEFAQTHSPHANDIVYYPHSIEEFPISEKEYDLVFTMATLQHIAHIKAIAEKLRYGTKKAIITIEDESRKGPVHYKHRYKQIFGKPPFEQTLHKKLNSQWDFPKRGFNLRVFWRMRK